MSDEFVDLFDRWSDHYDESVAGNDLEYEKVFESYNKILGLIAFRSHGKVIEFGVGTGNLTKELIKQGHEVIGIEPSSGMREIAKNKLPGIIIEEGDFLDFPYKNKEVDTLVSSYAFHHLTDDKKEEAIKLYAQMLNKGGKIIFGDTIFKDTQVQKQIYLDAKSKGYKRLANDLNTEYYTTIPIIDKLFIENNFTTHYEQINDFVWIIEAKKGEDINDKH